MGIRALSKMFSKETIESRSIFSFSLKRAQRILSVAMGSVKLSKDHHAAIKEERYIPHASHA